MTKYSKPKIKVLDDATIRGLANPPVRIEIADPKLASFYLLVQPSGKKSFAIRYEFDGVPNKWTMGQYPKLSLKDARAMAKQGFEDVRAGINPKLAKHQGADTPGWNLTKNVVRRWHDAVSNGTATVDRLAPGTIMNYLGLINRWFVTVDWVSTTRRSKGAGRFGERTIQSITKAELIKVRDDCYAAFPSRARNLMKALRGIFAHACREGLIEQERNPAHWVELGRRDAIRSRLLKPSELRVVLEAAKRLSPKWQAMVEMLLLTGKRRSEVQFSPRQEWNYVTRVWTIPAERVKTRVADYIPITARMVAIIKMVPRIGPPQLDELLFGGKAQAPAKRRIDKAIVAILARERGLTVTKEMTLATFGWEHWTWHDLRRTANVNWKHLGIDHDIREQMLNHSKGELGSTYDPDKAVPIKAMAYIKWAERIERIRAGLVADEQALFEDPEWANDEDEDAVAA